MSVEVVDSSAAVKWEQLPDILTPAHLKAIFQVKATKTISYWARTGQLPKPVLSSGNIRRWRKVDLQQHLENRTRMG